MFAAIYARVSTDEQAERENSIPAQIRAMREYCQKNNIAIYKEYIDEGISGQKENRPSFQKMLKDASKDNFSLILVHKFDRFARKIELSRKIKSQLKDTGINVISITEPIEDSPIGFFQEGLLELLAEYYIKNLSKETKKGMGERALNGKHMGMMPFGYYVSNGKVFVNEDQAKIVKFVFEKYNNGWGHMKIAKYLNENHVPTYTGKTGAWQSYQVKMMLLNKKYIGLNEWDGNISKGVFPTLVDEDLFYSVQNGYIEKKKQFTYRGNNYNKYVLLGLLKCAHCGSPMRIRKSKKWTSGYEYCYMCSSASLYRKNCDFTKILNSEILEKRIEDYIDNLLQGTEMDFKVIVEKPVDFVDILTDRLKKIDRELKRAKDAYLAEVFTVEEYKELRIKLETEKAEIRNEIPKDHHESNKNELIKKIKSVWQIYQETDAIHEKKKILMMFIKNIEISREKFEIIFYV